MKVQILLQRNMAENITGSHHQPWNIHVDQVSLNELTVTRFQLRFLCNYATYSRALDKCVDERYGNKHDPEMVENKIHPGSNLEKSVTQKNHLSGNCTVNVVPSFS